MMGWGPWPGPMWFAWLFPTLGLTAFVLAVVVVIRGLSTGHFVGMGRHEHERGPDETSELRHEVRELREELNRMKVAR